MKFWKRKKIVGPRPHGMTEAEVVGCFRQGVDAPLWRGVNALIDDLARERVEDACDRELPDNQTKFALGGVEFGAELKRRAMEFFQRAAQSEAAGKPE